MKKVQTRQVKKEKNAKPKVRKSPLGKTTQKPQKPSRGQQKAFVIYTVRMGKIEFARFRANQDDERNVAFGLSFTRKLAESSRFATQDSAREAADRLRRMLPELEFKVVECQKAKELKIS